VNALKAVSRHPSRRVRVVWAWVVVGLGAALGAVSLGLLLLVPVALLAALMASRPAVRRSAFGLLSGAGVLFLYVAYAQRDGAETTCWHRGTATGCDEHLNPLPWLVIGSVFLIGGIAGHVRAARKRSRYGDP
jgi:hypothetical protein